MKKKIRLTFTLNEILLLAVEINLAFAGLLMIAAAFSGQSEQLYAPARTMIGMLPALFCVGFASWLVYRLRCVRRARNRFAGLAGAMCLGIVALSFGAAVGKLSMVCMTDGFHEAVNYSINSPLQKQAGLMSFLAFVGIGLVFGATFVLRAGKENDRQSLSSEALHVQIGEIGQQFVGDWSEQLVSRMDSLVTDGDFLAAIGIYRHETGCTAEEASRIVDDWPEQRLRLQLEVLTRLLQTPVGPATSSTTPASLA
tara:strand:- start:283913 stop:284677 length:765 start_codon:yes stop_codon:yes gene_type:complete